ncbi:MAG: hypothetical protein IJD60_07955 [Clostridia bacterium]|nr:hypothetical protein [Clostridia bacterium]
MRVLDLDMDFFLSGPCPLAMPGERPDEACVTMAQSPRYAPASADRIMEIVRRYITEGE